MDARVRQEIAAVDRAVVLPGAEVLVMAPEQVAIGQPGSMPGALAPSTQRRPLEMAGRVAGRLCAELPGSGPRQLALVHPGRNHVRRVYRPHPDRRLPGAVLPSASRAGARKRALHSGRGAPRQSRSGHPRLAGKSHDAHRVPVSAAGLRHRFVVCSPALITGTIFRTHLTHSGWSQEDIDPESSLGQ